MTPGHYHQKGTVQSEDPGKGSSSQQLHLSFTKISFGSKVLHLILRNADESQHSTVVESSGPVDWKDLTENTSG